MMIWFLRLSLHFSGESSQSPISTNGTDDHSSSDEEEMEDEDEILDVEDIGNYLKKAKSGNISNGPKEMVSETIRKSLTKQVAPDNLYILFGIFNW